MWSKDDGSFVGGVAASLVGLILFIVGVRLGMYMERNHIVLWQRQPVQEEVR